MSNEQNCVSRKLSVITACIKYYCFVTGSEASFACDLGTVTLYCADNKTIDIESALYGINAAECTATCCPTGRGDCTENVEDTAPNDWAALLALCQDETFCQFPNPGRSLSSCPEGPGVDSDYIVVSYLCQPGTSAVHCRCTCLSTDMMFTTVKTTTIHRFYHGCSCEKKTSTNQDSGN